MSEINQTALAPKKYGAIVKAATLSIIVLEYTIALSTPALGAIAKAFPEVSPELIKQIQALPSLTMILMALMAGFIAKYVKKRTMIIVAGFVMLISCILPAFGGGIYYILFWRAIFGLGRGIIFPFAMSMIVELFDGKERNNMMGYRSATGSVAGIVFMQVGGILASINWRYCFLGALLTIPFLLLIIFKLPEPEKRIAEVTESGKSKSLTGTTWLLIFLNMVFILFAFSFITNTAIVITTMKLGNPSVVANVMSTFTIFSVITGLTFGRVFKPIFRKYSAAVGCLFVGAGIFIVNSAQTLPLFFVGAAVFGIGFSSYNTDMFLKVGESADRSSSSMALSAHMAFNGAGSFVSPIVLAFLAGPLGLTGAKAGWTIAGPVLLAGAVLIIILQTVIKSKKAQVNE